MSPRPVRTGRLSFTAYVMFLTLAVAVGAPLGLFAGFEPVAAHHLFMVKFTLERHE